MFDSKKGSLPRIPERKIKTESSNDMGRSIQYNPRRYAYNVKNSISNSEYLKNYLQKDEEYKRMARIYNQVHHPILKSKPLINPPARKSNSLHKNIAQSREYSQAEYPPSSTNQSHAVRGQASLNDVAADEVQIFYNLEIKRGQVSKQKLRNFSLILEDHNIFFQKMSRIINETLLNIGFIYTYNTNEYIYKENFPITSFGIILWGSTILKYKKGKAKFYCGAGNTIGEELVFERLQFSSKRFSTVENGRLCASERCKASQDCGILFVGQKQYGYMAEDLIKWGFKDEVLRFQNILHRNYFKKRQFKGLMN